jgi:hypothetical protein
MYSLAHLIVITPIWENYRDLVLQRGNRRLKQAKLTGPHAHSWQISAAPKTMSCGSLSNALKQTKQEGAGRLPGVNSEISVSASARAY